MICKHSLNTHYLCRKQAALHQRGCALVAVHNLNLLPHVNLTEQVYVDSEYLRVGGLGVHFLSRNVVHF